MARNLNVYLHSHECGHLSQDENGQLGFRYAPAWLSAPDAVPLSHSLPLREEPFDRKECAGFFEGLLPELGQREIVARALGITARNDFAMLERIGGECIGAVTFLSEHETLSELPARYRRAKRDEFAEIVRSLPRRPLLAGEEGIRLSLAGAQAKLAVRIDDGEFSIPLGNAPSTHIVKPAVAGFEHILANEALCMNLAKRIGIPTASVAIQTIGDVSFLAIERYDRAFIASPDRRIQVTRLHQEDFCQALGIVSVLKYQSEGGPSHWDCFDLVRATSQVPVIDLKSLFDASVFNLLIGNRDAHGKNFSLLRPPGSPVRLAPCYDLLSTAYYPELSKRMAMKLGSTYEDDRVLKRHFEQFVKEIGLSIAMANRRLPDIVERLLMSLPELEDAYPHAREISAFLKQRTETLAARLTK